MKKILYIALCVAGLFSISSCSDFFETKSPSTVDADFVFSNDETTRAAMYGVYEAWRAACQGNVFGDGLYYALDVAGSDIEKHPEAFSNQPGRHYPECLYQNGTYTGSYGLTSYQTESGSAYVQLYSAIAKANAVINAIEGKDNFEEIMNSEISEQSQVYGEAIACRAACYRELIRYYGDVPFQLKAGVAAESLTSRYYIYDYILQDLQRVAPKMYRVGQTVAMEKNIFSRTFVEGLIGRISLDAAGYQTRRTDLGDNFYVRLDGSTVSFEDKGVPNANAGGAHYGRPTYYAELYNLAKTYFKAVIDNSGSAKWYDVDPRIKGANGEIYDNPYQYFFQQMNDLEYADESIYEYAQTQGTGNDARPYSYGRPSDGGSSNAFPCKSYGQGRINPAFYWGVFDPKDARRDVSVAITGSTGGGAERLIPFTPNSKATGGGPSLNKWDECRMASPYCLKQRTSGINGPYMRMAEMFLGYAEACAATGDDATAKTYLARVRERSFPAGQAFTDQFIASCGSTYNAVIQERGFEYAGEGDRRWTLIRSGLLPEKIKEFKELTKKMIDGLETQGYYTFANGNQISAYVWTKLVDAKSLYGYRLTTQCPEGKEDDPVLNPGWRGQNNDWIAAARTIGVTEANITKNYKAGDLTNLAIKGLFRYIDPNGDEAKALEADGYEKVAYGAQLVEKRDEYQTYLFYDYDYNSAPIYLMPFTPNVVAAGFSNGYGFSQK